MQEMNEVESKNLRNTLGALIEFKNNFPRYNTSFMSIGTYYQPENSYDYIIGIVYIDTIFIYVTGLLLVIFIGFFFCRVCCKTCGATHEGMKYIEGAD